jgi:DNA polymerase I-like protein with 3'-5' exonuclease and polymerase domains
MLVCPKHRHFIDGQIIWTDTETTGKDAHLGDSPFCFSFANEAEDTCITFDVDPHKRKPIVRPRDLDRIKRLYEDPEIIKVGANTKFDQMMTDVNFGMKWAGRVDDVLWKAHICHSSEPKIALKPLSDKLADIPKDDEQTLGKAVKACRSFVRRKKLDYRITLEDESEDGGDKSKSAYKSDYWLPAALYLNLPPEDINHLLERWNNLPFLNDIYAKRDAQRTRILDMFYSSLLDDLDLWEVYEREMRMAPITYAMEQVGVRVFPDRCHELAKTCKERLDDLRISLSKIFGDFNIEVPDRRLRHYLFSPKTEKTEMGVPCLGLKPIRRTEKKKEPSVDRETKDYFGESVPVVKDILDYDRHQKVKAHYVDKYLAYAIPDVTGQLIIHANIRQLAAITGRMSITGVPLHQIPKRAKAGDIRKQCRRPLGPRERHVWICNDFKSVEPRILGEESDDEDIINTFNEGGDPYEVLVDRVCIATGICREALEALFEARGGARQVCKNNFLGWSYGEGIRKLAAQMGCPYEQAAQIIYAMQGAFKRVMPFMREMQDIAKAQGFVINRYGRKADIPPPSYVTDENGDRVRVEWYYKATNYLIQGTAADLLKESIIRLGGEDHHYDRWGQRQPATAGYLKGTGCNILLPVHDEVIVEVPWKLAANERFVRGIGEVMADNQGVFKRLTTPCDAHVTWNSWSDPEPLETLWE